MDDAASMELDDGANGSDETKAPIAVHMTLYVLADVCFCQVAEKAKV